MKPFAIFTTIVVVVVACSSSSTTGANHSDAKSCTGKDADCPSGQGCKTEGSDSYCAPLCSGAFECPEQQQCTKSTDAPKSECKEVGSHTGGKGVCDLFNGAFGPRTCSPSGAPTTTSTGTATGPAPTSTGTGPAPTSTGP